MRGENQMICPVLSTTTWNHIKSSFAQLKSLSPTYLLFLSKALLCNKVEDLNVGNPDVFNIYSQLFNPMSMAGVPTQEFILPNHVQPGINGCIVIIDTLPIMTFIVETTRKDSPNGGGHGLLLYIDVLYLLQCRS